MKTDVFKLKPCITEDKHGDMSWVVEESKLLQALSRVRIGIPIASNIDSERIVRRRKLNSRFQPPFPIGGHNLDEDNGMNLCCIF